LNPAAECLDSQIVRFERLLPGPVERVWDYLTQPDLQRTWLSVVSLELEPGTVIAVRCPAFSLCGPDNAIRPRQSLGPEVTQVIPSLKLPSSQAESLYGMLGGRC
jgi:hypothetical protein